MTDDQKATFAADASKLLAVISQLQILTNILKGANLIIPPAISDAITKASTIALNIRANFTNPTSVESDLKDLLVILESIAEIGTGHATADGHVANAIGILDGSVKAADASTPLAPILGGIRDTIAGEHNLVTGQFAQIAETVISIDGKPHTVIVGAFLADGPAAQSLGLSGDVDGNMPPLATTSSIHSFVPGGAVNEAGSHALTPEAEAAARNEAPPEV